MHHSVAHSKNSNHNHNQHAHTHTPRPIIEGIGQAIRAGQNKRAQEQAQHDELIRKTQELKDRERIINQRAVSNTSSVVAITSRSRSRNSRYFPGQFGSLGIDNVKPVDVKNLFLFLFLMSW